MLVAVAVAAWFPAGPADAADKAPPRQLVVAAGEVQGFHYTAAGALCRLLNRERSRLAVHCLVEPTGGSAANLTELARGEVDLALVQSRAQYQAVIGGVSFEGDGARGELRALFSLYGEPVAVVARKESGIKVLADLKGKKVNLGRKGSFQREVADRVLDAAGVAPSELAAELEIEPDKQGESLCQGRADALVVSAVHPAAAVQEALACGGTLVEVAGVGAEHALAKAPWLVRLTIPAGSYPGQTAAIATIGTRVTVMAKASLPEAVASEVTRTVLDNAKALGLLHPLLAGLERARMTSEGLSAPLHDGVKHLQEAKPDAKPDAQSPGTP